MTVFRIVVAGAFALTVFAADAAQRTFVATTGSDANVCSLVAPCRSFAAALAHTDPNGEVIVLDSGGYGGVTIAQSVTIEAPPGVYAGVSVFGLTNGVDIGAPGANIHLRGLSINGQPGNIGINVTSVGSLSIDRCRISSMGAQGINVSATGAVVSVTNSEITGNTSYGIWTISPLDLLVRNTLLAQNQDGIRMLNGARATLDGVAIRSNAQFGMFVSAGPTATPAAIRADRVVSSQNGESGIAVVGAASSAASVVIARSTFSDNAGDGVLVNAVSGPVGVTVSDSAFSGQLSSNTAISVLGANGKLVASRNVIVDNGGVGLLNNSATLESTGDNVLFNNNGGGLQTTGTITTLPGT